MKQIEYIFGFGRLQDLLALVRELEARGLHVEDLQGYVDNRRKKMTDATKGVKFKAEPCPDCGGWMALMPVNTGPRDQTGDDSTFAWMCGKCGECKYTNKTLAEILKEA